MVGGGGYRRGEGSLVIKNTNVFAALETLRKKKKSDKDRGSSKSKESSKSEAKEPEPKVFWAPTPLSTKSWADVDDEDDDDYYATTAPPQSVWNLSESDQTKEKQAPVEESESEDVLDEGDEEVEEEHDQEPEEPIHAEPVVKNIPEVSSAPKETERQLSKKERKKKELAEFEALLADFAVSPKVDSAHDESHDATKEMKDGDANEIGDHEKKEDVATESKGAKKKKRKDKSSKDVKDSSDVTNGPEQNAGTEQAEEEASGVDVKGRLKKIASAKKKKSNKELDAAARAAAIEAAARSARLAAAKKKEKNHYNQQPVR